MLFIIGRDNQQMNHSSFNRTFILGNYVILSCFFVNVQMYITAFV